MRCGGTSPLNLEICEQNDKLSVIHNRQSHSKREEMEGTEITVHISYEIQPGTFC